MWYENVAYTDNAQVIHPTGLQLEEPDIALPHGTSLALPISAMYRDPEIFSDPDTFDAFRFASDKSQKMLSSITADKQFLGFGFGTHACPGRFFSLNEVKLVVAHLLLSYDIEYQQERPDTVPLMWLNTPIASATVRVRRRRHAHNE